MTEQHRLGAWPRQGGTQFAVWSDKSVAIAIRWTDERAHCRGELQLDPDPSDPQLRVGFAHGVGASALYEVLLDGKPAVDPYARALPRGVHGLAEIVDKPKRGQHPKRRIELARGEVFYELHIGTFTPDGTFRSAAARLPELARLGVTVLELMPVAAFPGTRGWGYDGVALLAPLAAYGTVQELAELIDQAHGLGLSVILDVVYNHLGPDGNYLAGFSDSYFDSERDNPWGRAPAFDKQPFRRLIIDSARYWLEDVGFDGLRLDAVHELEPGGDPHVLQDLASVARSCSPPAFLVAEDDRNDPASLFAHGIDAVWSDDFHHTVHVLLTSERDGYYSGYQGDLAELARVIERIHLFDGQVFPPTGRPRGKPCEGLPRERFVYALQNHDQIGNRAFGERLHHLGDEQPVRALTLLWLLLPATPLLFMGQESGADEPFLYFTDHTGELGEAVTKGRAKEFGKFAAFGQGGAQALPDPQAEATFARCRLHQQSDPLKRQSFEFHQRALKLRREDPVLRRPTVVHAGVHGKALWVRSENAAGKRLLLLTSNEPVSCEAIADAAAAHARLLMSSGAASHDGLRFELPSNTCLVFALA
ncbi:MAG: alpha-amylase family glycosyl hydrolase [Pseudomonadota bacterium]